MATANNEFFEALSALEKERGLPEDYLIDKIKAAIVIAVKKDYEVEDDNVVVDIDPELGAFRASLLRDIVEEVENPHTQVSLEDAQKVRKSYKVGQRMVTPLKTKEFGRIAAQTAKHVIRQGLREGERNLQCSEMQSRAHELIAATVVSIDPERGNVVLDLGKGGSTALPPLPRSSTTLPRSGSMETTGQATSSCARACLSPPRRLRSPAGRP